MIAKRFRASAVAALVVGTFATGCEMRNPHDHGGAMVDEVRPEWQPKLDRAPYSAEYVLYGWQPIAPTTRPGTAAAATTRPGRVAQASRGRLPWEHAAEVERAFVPRGHPIGFRRQNGQLLAVADRDVRPLPAGHYCWHLLPGNPVADGQSATPGAAFWDGARTAGVVLVVGALVVAVGWLVYHEAHHGRFLDDASDSP